MEIEYLEPTILIVRKDIIAIPTFSTVFSKSVEKWFSLGLYYP